MNNSSSQWHLSTLAVDSKLILCKNYMTRLLLWKIQLSFFHVILNMDSHLAWKKNCHVSGRQYIYCRPQTDCLVVLQLICVARYARCFKLGSKTGGFHANRISLVHSHQQSQPKGMDFNGYASLFFCLHIHLTATECSIH